MILFLTRLAVLFVSDERSVFLLLRLFFDFNHSFELYDDVPWMGMRIRLGVKSMDNEMQFYHKGHVILLHRGEKFTLNRSHPLRDKIAFDTWE